MKKIVCFGCFCAKGLDCLMSCVTRQKIAQTDRRLAAPSLAGMFLRFDDESRISSDPTMINWPNLQLSRLFGKLPTLNVFV